MCGQRYRREERNGRGERREEERRNLRAEAFLGTAMAAPEANSLLVMLGFQEAIATRKEREFCEGEAGRM